MATYQMNFVPRDQLDQVDEGNVVVGVRLDGANFNVTDRYVATVNGLTALNESDAAVSGCFYTFDKIATQGRFEKINFIDCGPVDDYRAPVPEQSMAASKADNAAASQARRETTVSTPGPNTN